MTLFPLSLHFTQVAMNPVLALPPPEDVLLSALPFAGLCEEGVPTGKFARILTCLTSYVE